MATGWPLIRSRSKRSRGECRERSIPLPTLTRRLRRHSVSPVRCPLRPARTGVTGAGKGTGSAIRLGAIAPGWNSGKQDRRGGGGRPISLR